MPKPFAITQFQAVMFNKAILVHGAFADISLCSDGYACANYGYIIVVQSIVLMLFLQYLALL